MSADNEISELLRRAAKRYAESVANRYPMDDGMQLEGLARYFDNLAAGDQSGVASPPDGEEPKP